MSADAHGSQKFPRPDVSNRIVIAAGAFALLLMLVAVAALFAIYVWQVPVRTEPSPQILPTPQIRTNETLLRKKIESEQSARLSSYHWENSQKTLVGIPIERAMQMLAARGAKAYDPIEQVSASKETGPKEIGPSAAAANQSPDRHVPSDKQPTHSEKGQR